MLKCNRILAFIFDNDNGILYYLGKIIFFVFLIGYNINPMRKAFSIFV